MTSSFVGRFLFVCFLEYFLCMLWSYFIFLVNSPEVGFPLLLHFCLSSCTHSPSLVALCFASYWSPHVLSSEIGPTQEVWVCALWGAGAEPGWGLDKCTIAPWSLFCPTSLSAGEPLLVMTFLNLSLGQGNPIATHVLLCKLGSCPLPLMGHFLSSPTATELLSIPLLSLSGTQ